MIQIAAESAAATQAVGRRLAGLLRPGDVVILTTPPAFRWVQYTYAIEKGLNVFMEKPVTVDGPGTRKMLAWSRQDRVRSRCGRGPRRR